MSYKRAGFLRPACFYFRHRKGGPAPKRWLADLILASGGLHQMN